MSEASGQPFQELYREHAAAIGKTARAFTQNAADRDDLAQEILVALWQALPRFRGQAKLSTFVYRVAHSCALNWKRSRQRYAQKIDRFARTAEEPTASAVREDPRLAWLFARIHELPPVDRSLILLSLDNLSYAEIADVTGLSESNIGVRLHRLKQNLSAQAVDFQHES